MDYRNFIDAKKEIELTTILIEKLATQFWCTGNEKVADKLRDYAENISSNLKVMDEYVSKDISAQAEFSRQASHNMLESVIAGIEIGKEK